METKANYVVVGIFTLVAIVAAFGFVYWTAAIGDRGETTVLRVRIPGSASGLGRGSSVLFNGVKVGDVRRVFIDVTNPTVAIADTEIDRLTPITKSTRADIGLAGLTGQAAIELKGADPAEPNLLDEAERTGKVAEITANPSAVTNLLQTAQDIFKRTDTVLTELEGFTSDVRGPLTATVKNTEKFSDALAANSEGVDEFLESVTSVAAELKAVSGRLDRTLAAAEDFIRAVDRGKIDTILANVEGFTERMNTASARLEGIADGVDTTVASAQEVVGEARRTLTGMQGTLGKVDGVIDSVDVEKLRKALENIEGATASADDAAKDVAQITDTFRRRTDDVDRLIGDAGALAERLNQASARIDGILAKADDLIGSEGVAGVITEAKDTLQSYREVAETIGGRLDAVFDTADELLGSGEAKGVLTEATETLQSYRKVAETLDDRLDTVFDTAEDLLGSGEAKGVLTDASETLRSFRKVSDTVNARLEGILAKADDLLGSGQAQAVMADARATLKSFKQVADNVSGRIGPIAAGLQQFTNQGLRDVQALVRDSRRSVTRIEEAVTDLSRNPQRIITGGEGTVREYDGRARR